MSIRRLYLIAIRATAGSLILLLISPKSFCQESTAIDEQEIQIIQTEVEKNFPTLQEQPQDFNTSTSVSSKSTIEYSDLNLRKNRTDTIVVQKMSMPKTERFQLFAGFSMAANDQLSKSMGMQLRASYHFSEKWGAEISSALFSQTKSQELTDLESKQRVSIEQLVSPKYYFGANVYHSSIYGKTAIYNRHIIPFEIYETLGLGQITAANNKTAPALNFGLGQLFSRTRSDGFRWDLGLLLYQIEDINGTKSTNKNLFITLGWGFFKPN